MREFLAIAPRTGQNIAIFIREPLRAVSFEADGAHFHHATATLKVALPVSDKQITFISAHLCPNGPEVRHPVRHPGNAWSGLWLSPGDRYHWRSGRPFAGSCAARSGSGLALE